MRNIAAKAAELCGRKEKFALATVLESEGSTPRGAGSKMLIESDRTITGTVGGGKIESDVIEEALRCMETGKSRICEFLLKGETADSVDMTCGGRAEVLIQGMDGADEKTEALFARADKGYLITEIRRTGEEIEARLTLHPSSGIPELDPLLADFPAYARTADKEGTFYLAEALERHRCVYICGGGHVGLKTAQLAEFAGFDTIVVDDRSEFATKERFPQAKKVLTIPDYADCYSAMEQGTRYYLVIMTRGHRYDRDVLEQALKTDAPYIGMMGSRKKISVIFDSLKERGFTQADLDRVTTPIGISINSETPEEIAVSVVAQLIEEKNRG